MGFAWAPHRPYTCLASALHGVYVGFTWAPHVVLSVSKVEKTSVPLIEPQKADLSAHRASEKNGHPDYACMCICMHA